MHSGDDYVLVICSVCSGQFHRKDTILVNDKYNEQHGQIVCKYHLDETNPLSYPFRQVKERSPSNPRHLTRDIVLVEATARPNDSLPGAPILGYAQGNTFGNGADLFWTAPVIQGTSNISGYRIERADPQLGTYEIVENQTSTRDTYFNDITTEDGVYYSYRIAAINDTGMGSYSDEFFYPTFSLLWSDIEYIVDGDGNVIMGGDGYLLRSNHIEAGPM